MSTLAHAGTVLTTRVVRDPQKLAVLVPELRELYERCADATPFQRSEWMLSWIEAFSPRDLFVIEVRDQRRLVGFASLLIYARNHDRVLAFAGGGVSDYLGLLATPGRESEVIQSVLQCVCNIPAWNLLELTDISPHSSLLALETLKPYLREHDSCSVMVLPASEQELLHTVSPRQRANLRNARSRIQRAGGAQIEVADTRTLSEFLEDLFRLHTARWSQSGETGVLNLESVRTFHKLCAPALLANGVLKLHRLRVNGRTVAILHSLWERGKVYCYLQGFDPEQSFLSPGTYLMFEVIREAVNHRMHYFDFLRGREHYKEHWRAQPQSTYYIHIPRSKLHAGFILAA